MAAEIIESDHSDVASSTPTDEPRALRRRVLNLAWPVIGENMLETSLDIVSTILVSALGAAALAGVGSGQQILFFTISALSALSVGSSVLVAQAVGARDLGEASRLARQSLIWSVILSVPLALIGVLLARPIIGMFGLDPAVTDIGVAYLQVSMGTVVVLVALIIGGGVSRGAGDSRTPMLVTLLANLVNVGLSYGLIYGHFGFPRLGPVGSAWAAFSARTLALSLLLVALWYGRNGVSIAGRGWRPSWGVARRVLGLGIPASAEQSLLALGFLVLTVLVARLGTETLAAQRIAMSALSFSFLPGVGFGLAATALVAQSIGARRPHVAGQVGRIATTWAVIWMSTIGLLIFMFAPNIMRIFTEEAYVIAIGAAALRVMAFTQPFWGVGMVSSGALRGTGDTRFPLVVGTLGIWSAVGLVWGMLTFFTGSLPLVWVAFLITSPITAFVSWKGFQRRLRRVADAPM